MRMTYEEWDVWTRGSAIRRAGYAGFKRNVAVGLGNWSAAEVAAGNWVAATDDPPVEVMVVLREALEDEEPLVREHAAWALKRSAR
jgi:epoxyqueuosine reductase